MSRHINAITFERDSGNVTKSWIKHGVSKEECEEAFLTRPLKVFDDNKHSIEETRFVAYGRTSTNLFLTIVFTLRKNRIRIISARKQNKKERKIYDQK